MKAENPLFLKGLNKLRALAALAVIAHHIELFIYNDKLGYGLYGNRYLNYFFTHLGKNAVYLFFVLSGFLITYLLINENKKYGKINVMKFYWRRLLRIWPLYFVIMGISFLIVPMLYNRVQIGHNNNWSPLVSDASNYSADSLLKHYFFLSNLALKQGYIVVGASQSWSVAIEEQYYMFWPLVFIILLKFKSIKIFLLALCIVILILLKYFFRPTIMDVFSYEYILIGCLGALIFSSDLFKKWKQFFDKSCIYFMAIFLVLLLLFVKFMDSYMQNILISFAFLFLIILTVNNKNTFTSTYLDDIGKISYGVYMYHPFIMFLIFPLTVNLFDSTIAYILAYLVIITLTLLLSKISYIVIENRFIKLKDNKYKTL